jgi:nickel-dependent lactate racemase
VAQTTYLRYDRHKIPIKVPDHAEVLHALGCSPLPNPAAAVREALASPIGSKPLAHLLRERNPEGVVITISDITRPVPNRLLVGALLDVLHSAGVSDSQITVLIATGLHRPSTPEEKVELLGPDIAGKLRVVDHRSDRSEDLAQLPNTTRFGTRAWVNRLYMEADYRIVTGFIEPHFMAGFSGGRKGVCPGIVNMETVQKFHGFEFLNSPCATNFCLDGNPLHEEATDVAEMAGIGFLLNVGLTEDKQVAGVFAGNWREAFEVGARKVKEWTAAPCSEQKDVVVTCGGGYPLDKTLYQSGKGMCSSLPVVKVGGVVICASACSEGLGSPSFSRIMNEWGERWEEFLDWIRNSDEVIHDQWGFQMHCKVLQRVGVRNLLFACGGIPREDLRRMSLTPIYEPIPHVDEVEGIRRALQTQIDHLWDRSMAVIPEGPYVVPVVQEAFA